MVKDLLAQLERHWSQQGHSHGPPVTLAQLDEFERRYGVKLPLDMRAYFTALNGSELGSDGPMDSQLISFWHLSEIRPLTDERPAALSPPGKSCFVFADYSIGVHDYVIGLAADARTPSSVMVAYDDVVIEVAASFTTFLQRYLEGDSAVLFPDLPPGWNVRQEQRESGLQGEAG
jgi:hypothetical protein